MDMPMLLEYTSAIRPLNIMCNEGEGGVGVERYPHPLALFSTLFSTLTLLAHL